MHWPSHANSPASCHPWPSAANNRSLKELLNLINSPEMATAASVSAAWLLGHQQPACSNAQPCPHHQLVACAWMPATSARKAGACNSNSNTTTPRPSSASSLQALGTAVMPLHLNAAPKCLRFPAPHRLWTFTWTPATSARRAGSCSAATAATAPSTPLAWASLRRPR